MVMRILMVSAVLVVAALRLDAQTPATTKGDQPLRVEIARVDSLLFAAFNAGDLKRLKTFFAPDLEFYQDNEGLENYIQTMKDFQSMFHQPSRIRRELVPGSLEVYPIKNYGAIEVGSHRFCHEENGRTECGTFKFLHVWRKTGKSWRLSRIVSYAH
ncbi:MAG TPA: nuclear transport factor 2 family protein [Gemmatimonadaceae bacterium]|nr:nuclear transport factor 2 family protein [Gemmatimonadaceae bacterium]